MLWMIVVSVILKIYFYFLLVYKIKIDFAFSIFSCCFTIIFSLMIYI